MENIDSHGETVAVSRTEYDQLKQKASRYHALSTVTDLMLRAWDRHDLEKVRQGFTTLEQLRSEYGADLA